MPVALVDNPCYDTCSIPLYIYTCYGSPLQLHEYRKLWLACRIAYALIESSWTKNTPIYSGVRLTTERVVILPRTTSWDTRIRSCTCVVTAHHLLQARYTLDTCGPSMSKSHSRTSVGVPRGAWRSTTTNRGDERSPVARSERTGRVRNNNRKDRPRYQLLWPQQDTRRRFRGQDNKILRIFCVFKFQLPS